MQYVYAAVSSLCGIFCILFLGFQTVKGYIDDKWAFHQDQLVINYGMIILGVMLIVQGFMVMSFYNLLKKK